MGKYGSSNPHHKSEWIEVDLKEPSSMTGVFTEGQCQFPGSGFLNIYYNNIGRVEDPQKTIVKAEFEWKRVDSK